MPIATITGGDARVVTDATISSGSNVVTSSMASFTSGDIGKTVVVYGAGSASGNALIAVISSVAGSTATLSLSATVTVSSAKAYIGTDKTSSIQSALNSVSTTGDEVLLTAGNYLITSAVTLKSNTLLLGEGVGSVLLTTVTTISGSNAGLLFTSGGTDIAVTNLQVVQIGFTPSGSVTVQGTVGINTNLAVGSRIEGVKVTGPFQQGILVNRGNSTRIIGCHLEAIGDKSSSTLPGDAINIFKTAQCTIVGCTFLNCRQDAAYFGDSSESCFTGNTVVGSPEGVQVRGSCNDVVVANNAFTIATSSPITSFGVIVQIDVTPTPDTIPHNCVVSDNSFDLASGSGAPDFAISVDTGGSSVLTRTVVGDNNIAPGYDIGIYNNTDRCTLTGNLVAGAVGAAGIQVLGNYCTITSNQASDMTTGAGIQVSGQNNSLTGNVCTGNSTYGIQETGNYNVIVGNNCPTNGNATTDLISGGANSKMAYNLGRYTAKGAA